MTPAELDLLELALPVGAENGTSIKQLELSLGWSERKVREGIRELRRERHTAIVTLPRTNGVYVSPEDEGTEDLKRTRDGLHSRAMDLLVSCRELDILIADRDWQPTLFGEAS